MKKHKITLAPIFGYATSHELACTTCGRGVHMVYLKEMWPLVFYYRHNPK